MPTEYDPNELARLLGEGKSLHEIAEIVDGPKADDAAAANRQRLRCSRCPGAPVLLRRSRTRR